MKKTFSGYYRPTEDEFSELWKNCLFVLDANVLLNLYRYSQETSEELIGILNVISDRLWVPHQAALEYQRNRLGVIGQQAAAYDEIQKQLRETQDDLQKALRSLVRPGRHPVIEVEPLLERINNIFTEFEKELNERKQEQLDLLDRDHVRDAITALLDEKVGPPYSSERIDEIYKKGKTRYEHDIPPGYLDGDKGGTRQYGDLILWFQVIDKAKEAKKPIILVTDDRKEDWWWRPIRGKTIGPRPELIEEMLSQPGVSFYMYQADQFMKYAQKHLERQVKQEAINEVRAVRLLEEQEVVHRLGKQIGEILKGIQQAVAAAGVPHPMEESLRTMQQALAAAAYPHLMEESLKAIRQAAAEVVTAYPHLMEERMRAIQQAAAEAYLLTDVKLRAMQQEKAPRISHETTEGITEDGDIVSDSEPEEEPDESDEQPDKEKSDAEGDE